ncbi:MAG: hypothetical protein MJ188_10650 [Treponema sp.]|nr:hypothetical protein [Treponema sp.]
MEIASLVVGLISLILAIYSIRVSKLNAQKQQEFEEQMEQKRKQEKFLEERQEQLDWKEAERRAHNNPVPIFEGSFEQRVENAYKEVRSERILGRKTDN